MGKIGVDAQICKYAARCADCRCADMQIKLLIQNL